MAQIDDQIARFQAFDQSLAPGVAAEYDVSRVCEYGWAIRPRRTALSLPPGKKYALALMGLTHGNEFAGVAVVNEFLAHLAAGSLRLEVPIVVLLGNPWAARENKRFLGRDLNRSFARVETEIAEDKRARVLETVLQSTAYIVDIHQTARPSDRAFFIFPYHAASYAFARAIAPQLTVVTHWGRPFSAEGRCSDEYVISQGGSGVSIELGQNGFDTYQIGVGVEAALWAVRIATWNLQGDSNWSAKRAATATPELYTWAQIMPWPETGLVELRDGLNNFLPIEAGDNLGNNAGRPLLATSAGKILFPKYLRHDQQLANKPTELCRIMRQISPGELPILP